MEKQHENNLNLFVVKILFNVSFFCKKKHYPEKLNDLHLLNNIN